MKRDKFQDYNFFVMVLPLISIFLITGPFMPDLVIVITSIFFLIFFKKELIFLIREENILLFFLFFWLMMIISSILSDDPFYSLKSSFFYIRFIIFSVAVFYLIKDNIEIIEKFYFYLKIALFIVCVASLFEFLSGYDIFLDKKPSYRLTGTFGDEQIVGSFMSKIIPFFISLSFYLKKHLKLEVIFLFIFCYIITILSGERTAVFFINFFSFFAIFFWPDISIRKKIYATIFTLLLFFSIIFVVEDVKKRLIDLSLSQFGFFILDTQKNDLKLQGYRKDTINTNKIYFFSKSHEIHFLTAINIFKTKPIIGAGPKMFRKNCSDPEVYIAKDSCTTHPHNILGQVLAELGTIGFLFYLTAIFYLIKEFFITIKNKLALENNFFTSKLCLIFVFSQNLFFLLPAGNFLNNFMAAQMFLPLGFYIYVNRKIKSNNISDITNN